jgi:BirA family biotin operon repressor/biotin-[acetyl-CoA-carboxylase] ligase
MFSGNALDRLLIGIGLNVNQLEFSDELADKATSLRRIAGSEIEREKLLAQLLSRMEHEYRRWHKQNDALVKSINRKIIGYGEWVGLQVNGHTSEKRHKLLGINQKGELTAISKEGDLETFSYEQIRLATD